MVVSIYNIYYISILPYVKLLFYDNIYYILILPYVKLLYILYIDTTIHILYIDTTIRKASFLRYFIY